MKRLIFTVVLGDYDNPNKSILSDGFDHILFTDNPNIKIEGWQTKLVHDVTDAKKFSRELKINIHKYVKGYDVYVYIDGNYTIVKDLNDYFDLNFKGGFLAHDHPKRNNIALEGNAIVKLKKDTLSVVNVQLKAYKKEMPKGLYQNGFFIRDNSANALCESWFKEVAKHSYRDQISLPYVAQKHKSVFSSIKSEFQDYLVLKPHSKFKVGTPKIYYFQPMTGDKSNYGNLLNDHCALVPNDDDWICVTDQDTAFIFEYAGKQIELAIKNYGDNFQLIGCVTNRLGLKDQTPFGISDDPNILNHRAIAEKLYHDKFDEVKPIQKSIGGLFMLFQKKTWAKSRFIDGIISKKTSKFFDWHFCDGVRRSGGKIGIMTGLYLFHYYRLHKDRMDFDHLK